MKSSSRLRSVVFTILIFAATIVAQESARPSRGKAPELNRDKTRATELNQLRNKTSDRQRGTGDSRTRSREMMAERQTKKMQTDIDKDRKAHESFIVELEAIKKMALKEKANKTAALVTTLINQKNTQFKEKNDALQKQLDSFKEKMLQGSRRGLNQVPRSPRDLRGQEGTGGYQRKGQKPAQDNNAPPRK